MAEADKYRDFRWIKVKRSEPVEIAGVRYVPEAHHIEETSFLIEEVRKLAARIDVLMANKNVLT